jgi:2'-5' RNA ligase
MNHFFAIDLSPQTKEELARFVDSWKPSLAPSLVVRWAEPDDYHLTLNFLGNLSRTVQSRLVKAVAHVPEQFDPFVIHVSFTGAFDSARAPRILWAGLNEKRETTRLSKSIDHALAEHGFAIEPHSYIPHITLGRCHARRKGDEPPPIKVGQPINVALPVAGFSLVQTLQPEQRANGAKARYNIVHTFPLGNRPPSPQ